MIVKFLPEANLPATEVISIQHQHQNIDCHVITCKYYFLIQHVVWSASKKIKYWIVFKKKFFLQTEWALIGLLQV